MKRILSIFKRDTKSSIREFILLYIILAPIIIAIGLHFFIPSINSISFQFALDRELDDRIKDEFRQYGDVEEIDGLDALKERVNKVDDIIGITQGDNGKLRIVIEGNEKENYEYLVYQIINKMNDTDDKQLVYFSDIGADMPLVAVYGASALIIMAIILSGMVIGMNIIEEKESSTIDALNVTPMRRMEFIIGKSLLGFFVPIVEALVILWILNLLNINIGMILVMTIASSLIAIILGFLLGVLSSNQIAGIANMKFLLIIVSASYIGAVILPSDMQKLFYWSPLYWSTKGLNEIIMNSITWEKVGAYTLWIIVLTAIVFILFRKKVQRWLN